MAAVEKLSKQAGDGKHVPVKNARMGMPVISVLAGAATSFLRTCVAALSPPRDPDDE
jgi:hypothetical protein